MKIGHWDLYKDFLAMQEKRKQIYELVLAAEDEYCAVYKQYTELEKAYGTMPAEEWDSKERDLSYKVDEAAEAYHKLEDTLKAIDEAIELLSKLESCYQYLEEEAGIK